MAVRRYTREIVTSIYAKIIFLLETVQIILLISTEIKKVKVGVGDIVIL